MSDIFHDFRFSVQICHFLYNVINKHTHCPFSILSVTILFAVLVSDTLHDFRYSVQICHFLYNVTNKQTLTFPHHHPLSNNAVRCADV